MATEEALEAATERLVTMEAEVGAAKAGAEAGPYDRSLVSYPYTIVHPPLLLRFVLYPHTLVYYSAQMLAAFSLNRLTIYLKGAQQVEWPGPGRRRRRRVSSR